MDTVEAEEYLLLRWRLCYFVLMVHARALANNVLQAKLKRQQSAAIPATCPHARYLGPDILLLMYGRAHPQSCMLLGSFFATQIAMYTVWHWVCWSRRESALRPLQWGRS